MDRPGSTTVSAAALTGVRPVVWPVQEKRALFCRLVPRWLPLTLAMTTW